MKKFLLACLIGLSVTGLIMQYSDKVQENISNNILRLHIVANSDDPADQALKEKVRDRVVSYLSEKIPANTNLNQTKQIISENLENIALVAKKEIEANNKSYQVAAQLGRYSFPTRHYANFSLPSDYNALRISIGKGEGQNWWCVLYPNLCYVDGVVVMPKTSEDKLKGILTEDEISLISDSSYFPVSIKFKIVEFSQLHI